MLKTSLIITKEVAKQIWYGAQLGKQKSERFNGLSDSELETIIGQVSDEGLKKWAEEDKVIDQAVELSDTIGKIILKDMMGKIINIPEPVESITINVIAVDIN